ncbi:MAG TPA: hypothetical protein VN033_04450 [Vulgatibacter sp.]|nr:hypothetical protein [Vulgatibacter sp.]
MFARLGWTTALGALAAAGAASATTMLALSVDELTQRSDRVVTGRVVATEPRPSEDGRRISTVVTLQIDETWKGTPAEEVRILAMGGTLDGISQVVTGAARFEEGEEVVVFLRRLRTEEALFEVVGMAQGKLAVERDTEGIPVAVPSLEGLSLVEPGKREPAPAQLGGPIPVAALQERVRASTR